MHYTLRGKIARAHPYQLDPTLTVYGAGAEAEATGQAIEAVKKIANDHGSNKENPHNVTKKQVGLGNVDNTSDAEKPVSKAQNEAIQEAKNDAISVANEKATTETLKGTLLADGWSDSAPFMQTVSIPGMLSTDYPFVDIDLSDATNPQEVIEGWNMVGRVTVSQDDMIIAYCYEEVPTADIPIVFKVVR